MKFYKLKFSLDLKEIGDYPQIQNFKKGYNPNRRESCSQISRYFFGKSPDVEIDFDCLKLSTRAKLTDYVSCSYLSQLTGLLVSNELYKFLSALKMPTHISYAAPIYKKDETHFSDFKWVQFTKSYPEIIDYQTSEFYLDHSDVCYKKITINSYPEYKVAQDNVQYKINAKKLVLKRTILNEFDVVRIGIVCNEIYITEVIKDEMVTKEFTGIAFEPADNLLVV